MTNLAFRNTKVHPELIKISVNEENKKVVINEEEKAFSDHVPISSVITVERLAKQETRKFKEQLRLKKNVTKNQVK